MLKRIIAGVIDDKADAEQVEKLQTKSFSFERRINVLERWAKTIDEYNNKTDNLLREFITEEQMTLRVLQEEFNAIMNTPWYKMITKKQKANVLGEAILNARKDSKK